MTRFWHTREMPSFSGHCPHFAQRLIAWQQQSGRHALPWQGHSDPYPVWLSEIMLQQTQVDTVIPYYQKFLLRFPDLPSLAAADLDDVLGLWSGLGYYSRARNLHAAAKKVVAEYGGQFPQDMTGLQSLPGVGRSTAAAIAAFAFGQRGAILDGNVRRVLTRVFGVEGWPGEKSVEGRLWQLAESLLPSADIAAYTQGLMDLGATLCTRSKPRCGHCPFQQDCVANLTGRQREFPAARPKKSIPERETAMLVLIREGDVLLEKRPPTGIWGGLWSLPEISVCTSPAEAAIQMGFEVENVESMDGFSHTFTHFRLFIRPWRVNVRYSPQIREPQHLWLNLEDIEGAALPAPVRRILLAGHQELL